MHALNGGCLDELCNPYTLLFSMAVPTSFIITDQNVNQRNTVREYGTLYMYSGYAVQKPLE